MIKTINKILKVEFRMLEPLRIVIDSEFPRIPKIPTIVWNYGTKNNKCDVNFFNFDFDLKNQ